MHHVPADAVRLLYEQMNERSWAEFHRVAHAEEDQNGNERIESAALTDIIRVAGEREEAGAEFPESFEELCENLDTVAETMPHETTS